jgi:hypothetical protein
MPQIRWNPTSDWHGSLPEKFLSLLVTMNPLSPPVYSHVSTILNDSKSLICYTEIKLFIDSTVRKFCFLSKEPYLREKL